MNPPKQKKNFTTTTIFFFLQQLLFSTDRFLFSQRVEKVCYRLLFFLKKRLFFFENSSKRFFRTNIGSLEFTNTQTKKKELKVCFYHVFFSEKCHFSLAKQCFSETSYQNFLLVVPIIVIKWLIPKKKVYLLLKLLIDNYFLEVEMFCKF